MRSYLFAILERGGLSVIKLISLFVLARYISPSDFGVFSIAIALTSISLVIVDSGMGGALIREPNPTPADYSTVFSTNLVLAVALYSITFFVAPLVSEFYKKEQICWALRALSVSLLIRSFVIVQVAQLTRQERFGAQASVSIVAALLSLVVACALAIKSFGLWALILQQLSESLFLMIGMSLKAKGIPKLGFERDSFRRLGAFGFNLTLSSMIRSAYDNLSTLLIAKFYSVVTLGYFSQASRLNNFYATLITGVVDKVAFAKLSIKFNTSPAEHADYVGLLYRRTALIGSFAVVCTYFFSREIVALALGGDWIEAAGILKVLGLCGFGVVLETSSRVILKSSGHSSSVLKAEIIKRTLGTLVLLACLPISIDFMLNGLVFISLLSVLVNMYFIKSRVGYGWIFQLKGLIPATVAGLAFSVILLIFLNNNNKEFLQTASFLAGIFVFVILFSLTSKLLFKRYF